MPSIQEWIHKLEEGEGTGFIRTAAIVLGLLGLAVAFQMRDYRNFDTQEAMDSAQLARNIAEGEGYTTGFVRPLSLYLVQQHREDRDMLIKTGHPDLENPPVYPMLLAGLMKLLPLDYEIQASAITYQPERAIAVLNQLLMFFALFQVFRLGDRLFDRSVAWLATVLAAGTELLWRFSVSGLSTMLLIVLTLAVVNCLVRTGDAAADSESSRGTGWYMAMAALAGLWLALGGLTRYGFAWLLFPVLLHFLFYCPGRRWLMSGVCAAVFLMVFTPWLIRNYQVSGHLFGTAGFALDAGTAVFQGTELPRSLNPDFGRLDTVHYVHKFLGNTGELMREGFPEMLGSWIGAFFLVGLLMTFRRPALNQLRVFTVLALLVFLVVQALGKTHLSEVVPVVNSENFIVLLTPLIIVFGAGFYSVMLEQLRLPIAELRPFVTTSVILIASAPLIFALLPPRQSPLAYPPYYPPLIQKISTWLEPQETTMSDVPWAVAWYGDRRSIWTTLSVEPDFYTLNDFHEPIKALYLSPALMDSRLTTDILRGKQAQSWERMVAEGLLGENNLPKGFPLIHAQSDFLPDHFFLTDRKRWNEKSRQ